MGAAWLAAVPLLSLSTRRLKVDGQRQRQEKDHQSRSTRAQTRELEARLQETVQLRDELSNMEKEQRALAAELEQQQRVNAQLAEELRAAQAVSPDACVVSIRCRPRPLPISPVLGRTVTATCCCCRVFALLHVH